MYKIILWYYFINVRREGKFIVEQDSQIIDGSGSDNPARTQMIIGLESASLISAERNMKCLELI